MTRRGLPLRGDVLVRLRGDQKQDVIAARLGVSLKTLGNWENKGERIGGRAEPDNIAKLSRYWGLPQAELLAVEEPPAPIQTAEEVLDAIREQMAELAGVVADVAQGVEALSQREGSAAASSGVTPKRARRRGDPQAV